mgnify:CR=1 FL=1
MKFQIQEVSESSKNKPTSNCDEPKTVAYIESIWQTKAGCFGMLYPKDERTGHIHAGRGVLYQNLI